MKQTKNKSQSAKAGGYKKNTIGLTLKKDTTLKVDIYLVYFFHIILYLLS